MLHQIYYERNVDVLLGVQQLSNQLVQALANDPTKQLDLEVKQVI